MVSKLTNSNSIFSKEKADQSEQSFEDRAEKALENHQEIQMKCIKLGGQFLSILNDKTLEENKSPIAKNLEKETVAELCNLSSIINNDELEPEGSGSMALITLLLRISLLQRDKINNLSFRINKFELESKKTEDAK